MRPRFQADGGFNFRILRGLRKKEPAIDILTALEGGVIHLPDPEVLRIAANSGRILLSHDESTMPGHFSRFTKGQPSSGVILAPQGIAIGGAIDDLLLIWAATEAEEWIDRIVYLPLSK